LAALASALFAWYTARVSDDGLFLGETIDSDGARTGAALNYDPGRLTTHGVIVGMTGSGKTGLGVVMLEELLRRNTPCLILDPKGDMGNLALTFPQLDRASFEPWVDAGEAQRESISTTELAERKSKLWSRGLAGWGLDGEDIERLRQQAPVSIFTPGSRAGTPLNVLGSLVAPQLAPGQNFDEVAEQLHDEIEGFVSGLLGLIGIDADPLASREHILLTNLIEKSWRVGRSLDLPSLITQVQNPPLRKLGVFEVDAFFPPKDRMGLAMRINGLLATPGFARWLEGEPIDIDALFWTPEGKARASVVYLSHLSPEERQFVVTLVLSKVATWMQSQSGSSELRALVYMDEVFGFCPPTAAPPSKKPILTLLKQARAFGVGMVLSTQNPVDLDYKAMSNAGTWMIGRLQTERDKARILEGLGAASGEIDLPALDAKLSGLGKRQFLLHSTKSSKPQLFTTRWAMSYLRGPLTKEELERLAPSPAPPEVIEAMHEPAGLHSAVPVDAPATTRGSPPPMASVVTTPPRASTPVLADDESASPPETAPDVPVYYLDPAAEWADEVEASPVGKRLVAALAVRIHMKFDEKKADLDHDEVYEAIYCPLEDPFDPKTAREVDHDLRDFNKEAPERARWALPQVKIKNKTFFKEVRKKIKDHIYRNEEIEIFRNPKLKLYSRVSESRDDFATRCQREAAKQSEEDKRKLHERFEKKTRSVQKKIQTAERQLDKAEADASASKRHEAVSGIGSLLSVFFGSKSKSSMAKKAMRKAGGFSSRRSSSSRASSRVGAAEDKIEDLVEELDSIEGDLIEAIEELDARWLEKAEAIETLEVGLEKADIDIDQLAVL
jgi:hypothetical protein